MFKPRLKSTSDRSPAPGVVNCHSLNGAIYEDIDQGIDLGYEEAYEEEKEKVLNRMADQGIFEDHDEFDNILEGAMQEFSIAFESDSTTILVGDWRKNSKGLYEIDRDGKFGWAGSYNNAIGAVLTVEYSKYVADVAPTSPCYSRRDTGGPCGDLDSEPMKGETVTAFCLPPDYLA